MAKYLSDEGERKLKEALRKIELLERKMSSIDGSFLQHNSAAYVVRLPAAGLPGRIGSKAGAARCDVYRIIRGYDGVGLTSDFTLDKAFHQVWVLNFSESSISGITTGTGTFGTGTSDFGKVYLPVTQLHSGEFVVGSVTTGTTPAYCIFKVNADFNRLDSSVQGTIVMSSDLRTGNDVKFNNPIDKDGYYRYYGSLNQRGQALWYPYQSAWQIIDFECPEPGTGSGSGTGAGTGGGTGI